MLLMRREKRATEIRLKKIIKTFPDSIGLKMEIISLQVYFFKDKITICMLTKEKKKSLNKETALKCRVLKNRSIQISGPELCFFLATATEILL